MALTFHKVLALPATLAADAIYAVRASPASLVRFYVTSAGPTPVAQEVSPPPIPPLLGVGDYVDQALTALAPGTIVGAAGRIELVPFVAPRRLTIDEVGVVVTAVAALAEGIITIYAANNGVWPTALIASSSVLSFAATGYKSSAVNFTFEVGVRYWIGVWHSSTATLRGVAIGALPPIGVTANGLSYFTALRQTVAWGASLPDPWVYSGSQRVSTIVPSIRMRVASVG